MRLRRRGIFGNMELQAFGECEQARIGRAGMQGLRLRAAKNYNTKRTDGGLICGLIQLSKKCIEPESSCSRVPRVISPASSMMRWSGRKRAGAKYLRPRHADRNQWCQSCTSGRPLSDVSKPVRFRSESAKLHRIDALKSLVGAGFRKLNVTDWSPAEIPPSRPALL